MFEGCTIKYNAYQRTDEDGKSETHNCSVQIIYSNGMIKSVPMNNDNGDYQKILAWVAEGNTIEDAD